jgi:hypothetical protein
MNVEIRPLLCGFIWKFRRIIAQEGILSLKLLCVMAGGSAWRCGVADARRRWETPHGASHTCATPSRRAAGLARRSPASAHADGPSPGPGRCAPPRRVGPYGSIRIPTFRGRGRSHAPPGIDVNQPPECSSDVRSGPPVTSPQCTHGRVYVAGETLISSSMLRLATGGSPVLPGARRTACGQPGQPSPHHPGSLSLVILLATSCSRRTGR